MLRLISGICFGLGAATFAQAGTLENIRSSGLLQCGLDDVIEGYSAKRVDIVVTGLAPDFCRALAVAILGDETKVNFSILKPDERIEALQSGEIDILVSAIPVDAGVEANDGLIFVEPIYIAQNGAAVQSFGPLVRQGDDGWLSAVRWLRHALLGKKVTQRFGFIENWPVQVMAAIGGYEAMYGRGFGTPPDALNRTVENGGRLWVP
jgi:ABC-type amino acid transport substrate-binding protein